MKKQLITLALLAGLTLNSGALRAGDEAAKETGPLPAAFSLEPSPQDAPGLAKKKAALRLFKAYGVTLGQLSACQSQVPESEKTAQAFTSRNGNTLVTVMQVIKRHGGLTPEIKSAVDAAIAEEVSKPGDCRALARAVAEGERDLYKAPQFNDDYKVIRSK